MAFKDQYTKVNFVNKNDPAFVEGVSPSISAEHLNAIQDGIINSLVDADGLNERLTQEEANTDALFAGTIGVRCEVLNTTVTIPAASWTEDAVNMRYTATITNAAIRTDTDVDIILADDDKGKYSMTALDPVNGSVTIRSGSRPLSDLLVRLVITEVRKID